MILLGSRPVDLCAELAPDPAAWERWQAAALELGKAPA